MGRIGDYFPEDKRREFAEAHLAPGQVLYLFSTSTNQPKDKYVVLAYPGPSPLLFYINSQVHPFIASRPNRARCQIKIHASDYAFLDHDSFIDCSEIIIDFTKVQIVAQIIDDISKVKGELNEITKKQIVTAVNGATTISPIHKRSIIGALS